MVKTVYQQVTGPDIQGHSGGPPCPMVHIWQLYVAASRASITFVPNNQSLNVVYPTSPCATEERFIMLLYFYISSAIEAHWIYINYPMYPTDKSDTSATFYI